MYAAVGTDGRDLVVWGVGETEASAEADGRRWLAEAEDERGLLAVIEVSADVVADVRCGVVNCRELGMDCKALARELGFR